MAKCGIMWKIGKVCHFTRNGQQVELQSIQYIFNLQVVSNSFVLWKCGLNGSTDLIRKVNFKHAVNQAFPTTCSKPVCRCAELVVSFLSMNDTQKLQEYNSSTSWTQHYLTFHSKQKTNFSIACINLDTACQFIHS